MDLTEEDRALLAQLGNVKVELEEASERFRRLREQAFQRGVPVAAIARATREKYDAVRMARSRARV